MMDRRVPLDHKADRQRHRGAAPPTLVGTQHTHTHTRMCSGHYVKAPRAVPPEVLSDRADPGPGSRCLPSGPRFPPASCREPHGLEHLLISSDPGNLEVTASSGTLGSPEGIQEGATGKPGSWGASTQC